MSLRASHERPDLAAITTPRVKVCGIMDVEEAWLAVRYGASALGLRAALPTGSSVITESLMRQVARNVPPGVAIFLLTSQPDPQVIIEQHQRCPAHTIQLTEALEMASYESLREALPGVSLLQTVPVAGIEALEAAQRAAPYVDALLLDAKTPPLKIKELGSRGRDWSTSHTIRQQVRVPVFLAGDLTPENVREAVDAVGPFGLEVGNGVRTKGQLDERKLASFFKQLKR